MKFIFYFKYLGLWYEIERSKVFFEENLKCTTAVYGDLNATTISVVNNGFDTVLNAPAPPANGYATIKDLNAPNRLEASLNGADPGSYNVWTTDYDNYAVVYACTTFIPFVSKFEPMWILGRQPVLDAQIVQKLKADLKKR